MSTFRAVRVQLWILYAIGLVFGIKACKNEPEPPEQKRIELTVTATAYNSLPAQTDETPNETAWGDQLEPGMKAIAVSRDLIALGLDHQATVQIEGFEGTYVVLDKMAARWEKRIDIYMGEDLDAARAWGVKEVEISWLPLEDDAD